MLIKQWQSYWTMVKLAILRWIKVCPFFLILLEGHQTYSVKSKSVSDVDFPDQSECTNTAIVSLVDLTSMCRLKKHASENPTRFSKPAIWCNIYCWMCCPSGKTALATSCLRPPGTRSAMRRWMPWPSSNWTAISTSSGARSSAWPAETARDAIQCFSNLTTPLICAMLGGEIITIPLLKGYSTTSIIEKIKS